MSFAIYTTFILGVALQLAAAAAASSYMRETADERPLGYARWISLAGVAMLGLMLALRWIAWGRIPLTSGVESLTLFTAMVGAIAIGVTGASNRRSLVLLYIPALAGISLIAAYVAYRAPDGLQEAPKELSAVLLLLHVVPAFLAYAFFFVAMLTSAVYLFQARSLKQRKTLGLFQHLPSLANLDSLLFGLIRAGYPLFILTLLLGYYWAWYDRELLGAYWWVAPKIVLSLCMVVLYGICYHGRSMGSLRGPRLAQWLLIGFGGLILAYFLLEVSRLTNYNFWVTGG